MLKLKNMNEKRFVDHDTAVKDYVKSLKNKYERENETRCEIAGNVFEKWKERQVRSARHRAHRIKQAPYGVYSFCET